MNLLIHPWRILAVLGAAVCFYMALFLYKDERDRLQNYLEDWWVKLHDKQKEALSKHTAFMQTVAEMSSRAFDRVFGKKYFSMRAIVVSICISTVSFLLGIIGVAIQFEKDESLKDLFLNPGAMEYCGICFFFAILLYLSLRFPTLAEKKAWLAFVFVTAIALVARFLAEARFGTFHYQPTFILLLVMAASGVLLLSFGVDLLFIAGTRWAVSWSSGSDDFFKILTVICLNIVAGVCLVYWPLMWSFKGIEAEFMRYADPVSIFGWTFDPMIPLPDFVLGLSVTNLLDGLSASVFSLVAFVMLIHRLFWPILSRPVYALAELGLVQQRKLLGVVGLALIALSTGHLPDIAKQIIEVLTSK